MGEVIAEAITAALNHNDNPRRAKLKVQEPDQFDGTNPKKLQGFILQCELYFRNFEEDYLDESKRVNFALTYLKGSALEWFEPHIIEPALYDDEPDWLYAWPSFVSELRTNFGTIDPRREAEEELEHAKERYDEVAEDVKVRMDAIREGDLDSLRELGGFLDTEIRFAEQYLEALKEVKTEWPEVE